jgi:hypothetical protein
MIKPLLAASLALALAGCAAGAPSPNAGRTVTAVGTLAPQAHDGRLLAAMAAWDKSSIDHAVLTLATTAAPGTAIDTLSVDKADLDKQVSFANLKQLTDYQVTVKAYRTAGTTDPIDNSAVDASSCLTAFSTTTDPVVSIGKIKLKLADQTYSGATQDTTIDVTAGALNNATPTEKITLH